MNISLLIFNMKFWQIPAEEDWTMKFGLKKFKAVYMFFFTVS